MFLIRVMYVSVYVYIYVCVYIYILKNEERQAEMDNSCTLSPSSLEAIIITISVFKL